jgi:hypothetical protein
MRHGVAWQANGMNALWHVWMSLYCNFYKCGAQTRPQCLVWAVSAIWTARKRKEQCSERTMEHSKADVALIAGRAEPVVFCLLRLIVAVNSGRQHAQKEPDLSCCINAQPLFSEWWQELVVSVLCVFSVYLGIWRSGHPPPPPGFQNEHVEEVRVQEFDKIMPGWVTTFFISLLEVILTM